MSSYFPNRWPLSYLKLIKIMKTYIRRQQHKNVKHQDIKQKEPPQKYRLGTMSNTKLLAGLNRFYRAITTFIGFTVKCKKIKKNNNKKKKKINVFFNKISLSVKITILATYGCQRRVPSDLGRHKIFIFSSPEPKAHR